MSSTLSSPSLCQQSQCDAYQFTICRHCQLFLCIRHLAEHQQQFPSDFQRLLDDARRQQAQLASFDKRLAEQRLKLNQVLDNEMEHFRQLNAYVQSKTSITNSIGPDDFVNMRSCLARLQQTAAFLPVIDKIGQLIGEHESATATNTSNAPFNDESVYGTFGDSRIFSLVNLKQEQNPSSTTYSNLDLSSSLTDKLTENDEELPEMETTQTHSSLTVRELKTYKCDYCPLATNTYGIEQRHQVRHIPCIRRSNSQISLFEHLKQYHYLNYAASMQIVRFVSSGDLDDHPTLFSSATESSIVSILPSFFRAPCPLTRLNVFGIGPMHGIRLCSPSAEQQDFALYDHFLAYHQLNRASAMKLVKAMMKNENSSQRILFRPDEQVLNETAYVSCPLSNYNAVLPHQERIPHTPCQSTVKLRYLTGHLRDVHHLNKTAAKRIASALRNEQGTVDGRSIGLFERDENILKAKKKKTNANRFRPPAQLAKYVQQNNNLNQQQPQPPPIW
ncbi:unnamed protein product [Rotaria socialis]|uniref:Uncharacterized protein n=1 Tax=Rotaria socialis TaxID=392032 RepID=A0A818BRC2_9BILA|nr:unnamed protein product [Rotaria socialis]CAF3388435.1 unnamed protein product [Rotaria socialis]CAF3422482.1 unnamed protein product [Rotaria socialis]CAF3523949.1 unnamed protein product [Rotaria socialis]CAF3782284.1 unnamed protein product [Rotaria socialis]